MEIFAGVDFGSADIWLSLLTLTFLEIVLGIDNVIFISILADKLPQEKQGKARTWGLGLALVMRIAMLFGITWLIQLTNPLFTIPEFLFIEEAVPISIKDLILMLGGLFLLGKSVTEIHHKLEGGDDEEEHTNGKMKKAAMTIGAVIFQIVMLDLVFSFDSILTAVGLTDHIIIMVIAVTIAIIIMMLFSGKIASFINKRPTLQILALAFLILIGFTLILDGLHVHVSKGYIYFAVAFSLGVEIVNIRMRRKSKPVELKTKYKEPQK